MASAAKIRGAIDPLKELQKTFCLFKLEGTIWIADQRDISSVHSRAGEFFVSSRADGKLLMQRFLETLPVASDAAKVVHEFMISPNTIVYDAVAFSPLPVPQGTLNYWVGSPIEPARGDWGALKGFLLWVICGGDIALYRYLFLFLAHMLQKPEEKPGIMIVLLGGQGTGKGTFFELLRAIWPKTTLQVSDVSNVIGHFNAAIERNYVVCMDEAIFAGDKRATDRLKSFVTERVVTIEQKYQPRRTISSFHRFFSSSNHTHFAQVDADDRRFFFLRVADARKGDHAYWQKVHQDIADASKIAAMVHDLRNFGLNGFNVRERPKTRALMDQKLRSLSGFERYWYDVLHSGAFGPGVHPVPLGEWSGPCFVSTTGLMTGWKEFEKGQRLFGPRQERDAHKALERLCPSANGVRRKLMHSSQVRGFSLPSLPAARAEFANAIGGDVEWHD